jgi:hypothetical protein
LGRLVIRLPRRLRSTLPQQRRHQRVLPILPEHRQLAGDALAIGCEAHGQPTFLVDVLLDDAGGLDLGGDGVEAGVVVPVWRQRSRPSGRPGGDAKTDPTGIVLVSIS